MSSNLVIASAAKFGRERKFLPPRLRDACKFLCSLQLAEAGWPQYEGGKISLYHTFLVVSALRGADHDAFATKIASTALRMRSEFGNALSELDMGDLAYFLRILLAESQADQPSIKKVSDELRARIELQTGRPQDVRVRELANAIAALSSAGITNKGLASEYVRQVLSLENAKAGGWPGAPNGDPSLVATAEVVEALHSVDSNSYVDPIQRGLRMLNAEVERSGWTMIGAGSDVFTQSTVLRVLATCDSLYNETVETGISALEELASNDRRGWGPGPGEASTIEATASAVRALISSEENRFVPYRVAAASVADASSRINTMEAELAMVRQELDDRVSREASKILEDRNRLRTENELLREEAKKLEIQRQEALRAALEEARRNSSLISSLARQYSISPEPSDRRLRITQRLIPVVLVCTATLYAALYLSGKLGSRSNLFFIFTLVAVSSLSYFFNEYLSFRNSSALARRIRTAGQSTSAVSSSVLEYSDIASLLPVEIREELTYLLASRLVEMPPAIGTQYIRSTIDHMNVPSFPRERVLSWVTDFLRLDSYSRRAVIEQIRRQTLAS